MKTEAEGRSINHFNVNIQPLDILNNLKDSVPAFGEPKFLFQPNGSTNTFYLFIKWVDIFSLLATMHKMNTDFELLSVSDTFL